VMSVLSEDALTVPQAARRLGTSRQNVQRVANELVAEGILETHHNPDHQTSPLLRLTDAGQAVLKRITLRATRAHEAQTRNFTDADIAAHRAFLRSLISGVRNTQGGPPT
jgi:DNA-binding MarR family transcriptional regulator